MDRWGDENMNEQLVKAYDLIKEEQRNADTKANIFVVLLTAFLSFFGEINLSTYTPEQIEGIQFLYLVMILPLLLLVVSLMPIYKHTYNRFKKKKELMDFNIFYWRSVSNLDDSDELYNKYLDTYIKNRELSIDEKHLLNQIKVNAEILERKTYLHKRAFFIIGQMILLFMISVLTYFMFADSLIAFGIIFAIFEIIYLVGLFKKPNCLYNLLTKISNKI